MYIAVKTRFNRFNHFFRFFYFFFLDRFEAGTKYLYILIEMNKKKKMEAGVMEWNSDSINMQCMWNKISF